jgi:hypothetical protein
MQVTFRSDEKSSDVLKNTEFLKQFGGKRSKLINRALVEYAKNNAPLENPIQTKEKPVVQGRVRA